MMIQLTPMYLRSYIRSLLMIRSFNNALAFSLPTLASVLSFVVYSLAGHKLDAANIFASLTLFQLLRMPLTFLRKLFLSLYGPDVHLTSVVPRSLVFQFYRRCSECYQPSQRRV